jgi:hypothetical protein
MTCASFALLCFALLSLPISAKVERPSQDSAIAPVVLMGTVESVDERWDFEFDYFQVSVRVEQLERGEAIQPGKSFVVTCFRWSRPWPGKVGPKGHTSIPDVGDRIRLFAWPRDHGHEGNYPNWYDVVEPSPRSWFVRLFDHRKFRAFCLFFEIVLAGFLVRQVWKRA